MKDREKLIRAFDPIRAPEDTLERVYQKAHEKKKKRGFRGASLAIACALVICFFGAGGYAAKQFTISRSFLGKNAMKTEGFEAPSAAPSAAAPAFASIEAAKAVPAPDPEEFAAAEAPADISEASEQKEAADCNGAINGFAISCPFGYENPYIKTKHSGIDFAAEEGTPVLAAADGTVVKAEFDVQKGNYIEIEHREGFSTVYCNLKEILTEAGAAVLTGDQIGTVGKTGMATGPHLHLELLQAGEPVDPALYWEN